MGRLQLGRGGWAQARSWGKVRVGIWRVCLPTAPQCTHLGDPGFRLLQTWMNAPPRSMGAARELTASTPLAPTAVPATWASLGMASPVKVRSGHGMGGLEGSRKDSQGLIHSLLCGFQKGCTFSPWGQRPGPESLGAVFSPGLQMRRVFWVWEQEYLLSVGPPPQMVSDHVPCPLPGPDSITCPLSRGLSPPGYLPTPWNSR